MTTKYIGYICVHCGAKANRVFPSGTFVAGEGRASHITSNVKYVEIK